MFEQKVVFLLFHGPYIPLIGETLGNWMHYLAIRRFKSELWNKGPKGQSASAAYFYHHFQIDFWLSLLGRKPPIVSPPLKGEPNPSCPILFLYGAKGLGGAFKAWFSALRERSDCDVKKIDGDHWFLLKSPEETSSAVLEWLAMEGGGKLKSST